MYMDICSLIKDVETRKFYFEKNELRDNLQELLESSNLQDVFYVGTNQFVLDYYKNHPDSEWKIKNIFQLGFPLFFIGPGINKEEAIIQFFLTDAYWSLFVFTKSDFENVIIGFDDLHRYSFLDKEYRDYESIPNYKKLIEKKYGKPIFNNSYNNSYYFELINYVIKNNVIPQITEEMYKHYSISFNSVPKEKFFIRYLDYLSRYKKSVIDDFGLPEESEKIISLKNLIQFVKKPSENNKEIYKERDIVTNGLFMDEYANSVYGIINIADKRDEKKYNFILRCFSISPYYLWAILSSEFIKDYCLANYEYNDYEFPPIPMDEFPCFITKDFNESYFKKKYEITKQDKLSVHAQLESKNSSVFYDKSAKEIILKDLNELQSCFDAKAYKSAIIMAGSILEAFVIDWLSEKDGKNYFTDNLMVYDKHLKIERRADLKDYIDKLQSLEKSFQNGAASKATEIRKKRNLVHAKLYINESDISKETCSEIIDYLQSVVNTRWNLN